MFILSFVRFLKKLFYSIYTNQVAQNFKNFSLGLVFFVDALAKSCSKQNLSECSQLQSILADNELGNATEQECADQDTGS